MSRRQRIAAVFLGFAALLGGTTLWQQVSAQPGDDAPLAERSDQAEQLQRDGNIAEAYDLYRVNCLDPAAAEEARTDLPNAVQCLRNLSRASEIDELVESTVEAHANDWRVLMAAAMVYQNIEYYGFIIAGEFERGSHRGGGQVAYSLERDRVRSLQLMDQARPLVVEDNQKQEVAQYWLQFGRMVRDFRGMRTSWRLTYLTNLEELPDYDESHPGYGGQQGAPVDADGNPTLYPVPETWETATNDGERWRWCLAQAVENDNSLLNQVRWDRAQFLMSQFGVQTMAQWGIYLRQPQEDDQSGTFALHTLDENETIARLAVGVRRFELPDEFNHIKILEAIADDPETGYGEDALNQLAQIFENRRQYPRAAQVWEGSIEQYGAGNNNWKADRLAQIVDNWGRFEGVSSQPAGQGATVEFRYRHGEAIELTAHEIDVEKLLTDVKDYLRGNPQRIDWQQVELGNIGYRLVTQNQEQYVGEQVAQWNLELDPRPSHFDRRTTIATPLQKAGAYLVTAKMKDGNTSRIVLWVADTAIVQKPLAEEVNLYYVADAVSGDPLPGMNVEFFGYQQEHIGDNRFRVNITNFAEATDAQGMVTPDKRDLVNGYNWLVTARDDDGRLAYLGFRGVWGARYHDAEYNATKIYTITDRPVYRPGDTVHYKFWARRAQYDQEDVSQFAGRPGTLEIYDPVGEKVETVPVRLDEYGGVEGGYELGSSAKLGQYRLQLKIGEENRWEISGGNTFRVEEYKKPEYEVTIDAPTEPVMLGDTVAATINARYYFGAPVTQATVKYTITRQSKTQEWYPWAPWDWFYGRGYWWYAYDYPWYPGWSQWAGCQRPMPFWWPQRQEPAEVVAENEVSIGPDGTVEVLIDTMLAKELHGDTDHQYTITAEVRDSSRRTIVGTGQVLVARQPFKVFTWVDRGYYRVGDTVDASFLAQTLDQKPVEGAGTLTLYQITYDEDRQPIETEVQNWDLATGPEGRAGQQLVAAAQGQYRLSLSLTDQAGHEVEGGYIFTVMGEGFDASEYRFNHLELIPQQAQYEAGETIELQINTDRPGSTVLLFVRPSNGVYLPPQVLHLEGQSAVAQIEVGKKDMPNFFVEAVTIAGGEVYTEVKEIVVPPESRMLDIEVLPSQVEYKPGEEATVEVKITDETGEPFVGSTVLSVYDKAVEYISGGSNVPEIREFFWQWRRHHNPNTQSSLQQWCGNLLRQRETGMSDLGVFGATVVDEITEKTDGVTEGGGWEAQNRRARGGGFAGEADGMAMDAAPPGAPMAAAARGPASGAAYGDDEDDGYGDNSRGEAGGGQTVEPTIRSNFADTAFWAGSLETNVQGIATVTFPMPENLSTWKVQAWGMGHGTRVGSASTEVITTKDLLVRLQAPRFFVQTDEVVLSAVVHNYLDSAKDVEVVLEIPGGILQPLEGVDLSRTIQIAAQGEARVDWRVRVVSEGEALVRMSALTDEESDAMEMTFPSFVHGMLKQEAWAGTVRPDNDRDVIQINVPEERRPAESVLTVRYSPTLAAAMVDALPYLADYPYGCTEQTLNRFLPTVVTQRMLQEMDLDLAAIREKRTNLNAQELGDPQERGEQWERPKTNPVFDEAEVDRMVSEGLKTLTSMQLADGGWGWFSGWGERSYPHTTATVVHGLQVAQANDVPLVPGMLDRGIEWLANYQAGEVRKIENAENHTHPWKAHADNLDALVYMVLADAGRQNGAMRDFLFRDRNHLSVYAKAMYGLALETQGEEEKLAMILRNIEQFLVVDDENDTAYLRMGEAPWWYWYGSEIEADAYYLKLLSRTDPEGEIAPQLVKYLLNNRKHATYWNSTRDTALCVEAFCDYLRASGELSPDMTVEVWVDGEMQQEVEISAENLFSFNDRFVLTGEAVTSGSHDIEIRRRGEGSVYWNVYLTNFTLEEHITAAGLEVKVERQYYLLVPADREEQVPDARGQAHGQRVQDYDRVLLENLDTVQSGDMVEVELVIESKNDYEYILFEDMKPAGFEPVELQSGYSNNGLGAYMELRDERVSFFVRWLARGKHSINYRMRAETPGRFAALPARAEAMYAPELKGNSDEIRLNVEDTPVVEVIEEPAVGEEAEAGEDL